MEKALNFWQALLEAEPKEVHRSYYEFEIENCAVGISLNDYNDKYVPSNGGPVFYATEEEAKGYLTKVTELGGKMVFNGLADPALKTIVFTDPCGNEFAFKAL
jgi:predicted enzyme related to lactoylglutathione lyase